MLESQKATTAKILIKAAGRLLLADPRDICYATIEDGVITVATSGHAGMEGQFVAVPWRNCSTTLTPACSGGRTGRFWSTSNTSCEVVPWFKSSYQLRMDDKKQTEIPEAVPRRLWNCPNNWRDGRCRKKWSAGTSAAREGLWPPRDRLQGHPVGIGRVEPSIRINSFRRISRHSA